MPRYDYKCPNCGARVDDQWCRAKDLEHFAIICDCGTLMERQFPLPSKGVVKDGTPTFHHRAPRR